MRKIIINTAIWPCRVLETGRWFGLCMSASSDSCNIYGTPEFQCSALSSSVNGYSTFQELLNDVQSLEEKGLIEAFNSSWVQVRRQCFCVSAELIAQIQTGHSIHETLFRAQPVPFFLRTVARNAYRNVFVLNGLCRTLHAHRV